MDKALPEPRISQHLSFFANIRVYFWITRI